MILKLKKEEKKKPEQITKVSMKIGTFLVGRIFKS